MGSKKKNSAKKQEKLKGQSNGNHSKPAASLESDIRHAQVKTKKTSKSKEDAASSSVAAHLQSTSHFPWRLLIVLSFMAGGIAIVCTNDSAKAVIDDVYWSHIQPQVLRASESLSRGFTAVSRLIEGSLSPSSPDGRKLQYAEESDFEIQHDEEPDVEIQLAEEPDVEIQLAEEPDVEIQHPEEPDVEIQHPEEPDIEIAQADPASLKESSDNYVHQKQKILTKESATASEATATQKQPADDKLEKYFDEDRQDEMQESARDDKLEKYFDEDRLDEMQESARDDKLEKYLDEDRLDEMQESARDNKLEKYLDEDRQDEVQESARDDKLEKYFDEDRQDEVQESARDDKLEKYLDEDRQDEVQESARDEDKDDNALEAVASENKEEIREIHSDSEGPFTNIDRNEKEMAESAPESDRVPSISNEQVKLGQEEETTPETNIPKTLNEPSSQNVQTTPKEDSRQDRDLNEKQEKSSASKAPAEKPQKDDSVDQSEQLSKKKQNTETGAEQSATVSNTQQHRSSHVEQLGQPEVAAGEEDLNIDGLSLEKAVHLETTQDSKETDKKIPEMPVVEQIRVKTVPKADKEQSEGKTGEKLPAQISGGQMTSQNLLDKMTDESATQSPAEKTETGKATLEPASHLDKLVEEKLASEKPTEKVDLKETLQKPLENLHSMPESESPTKVPAHQHMEKPNTASKEPAAEPADDSNNKPTSQQSVRQAGQEKMEKDPTLVSDDTIQKAAEGEEPQLPVDSKTNPDLAEISQKAATAEKETSGGDSLPEESYVKAAITNKADFKIRKKIDAADELLEQGKYEDALRKYDNILRKHPSSPRAQLGRADTLDKLAAQKRSNDLLEQSISGYDNLFSQGKNVPPELTKAAGRRLADRQQFRGWGVKAAKTMESLTEKFPDDISLQQELGVFLLLSGQNEPARQIFQNILKVRPDSGFAQVHLGFIIKTQDNDVEKAISLLQKGINSQEPGTQDGRFFFHLGDAYQRLGHNEKARRVYQRGAEIGLFLSADQRSLYNVDNLTGRPWWTPEQTGYQNHLKLLEDNWRMIRDEGLSQLDAETSSFQPEAELLREKGDWKQLTLFQQGKKNSKVCNKVPKTCALLDQIPDASGCKRGQVKFSVMSPGVHVWPHCGPTNCRIRAHLGLVVPEGPKIRVVNETRTWQEGKFIIFDDSFEHEVWHDGKSLRLVLIVDFWHPEITEMQKRTLAPI